MSSRSTVLHTAGTAGVLRFIKCTSQVPRPWGRAKRFCRWGAYSTMKTGIVIGVLELYKLMVFKHLYCVNV
jgi:hypothetical protein